MSGYHIKEDELKLVFALAKELTKCTLRYATRRTGDFISFNELFDQNRSLNLHDLEHGRFRPLQELVDYYNLELTYHGGEYPPQVWTLYPVEGRETGLQPEGVYLFWNIED